MLLGCFREHLDVITSLHPIVKNHKVGDPIGMSALLEPWQPRHAPWMILVFFFDSCAPSAYRCACRCTLNHVVMINGVGKSIGVRFQTLEPSHFNGLFLQSDCLARRILSMHCDCARGGIDFLFSFGIGIGNLNVGVGGKPFYSGFGFTWSRFQSRVVSIRFTVCGSRKLERFQIPIAQPCRSVTMEHRVDCGVGAVAAP